jgi:hypothetical protein
MSKPTIFHLKSFCRKALGDNRVLPGGIFLPGFDSNKALFKKMLFKVKRHEPAAILFHNARPL